MEFKGLNANKITTDAGLSVGLIGKSIKNRTGLNSDTIEKLLYAYPDLNASWLLTGIGKMLITPITNTTENAGLACVGIEAIGGDGNSAFSFSEKDIVEYYNIPEFIKLRADFVIGVSGNSMQPKYNTGDKVACRIIKDRGLIEWGKPHVIATRDNGILIKRIKRGNGDDMLKLISENTEYDPIEVHRSDVTGIAVVLGSIHIE